jgi:hypothetical protein
MELRVLSPRKHNKRCEQQQQQQQKQHPADKLIPHGRHSTPQKQLHKNNSRRKLLKLQEFCKEYKKSEKLD